MASFADQSDLTAMYPALESEPKARVDAVLANVSAAIAALCDTGSIDGDVLKLVTVRVAARMLQSDDSAGVSQESWAATPFSGSTTYANPSGDIYLTAFEKRLLGIDGTDCEVHFANPGVNYE